MKKAFEATDRQREVLEFIRTYKEKNQSSPSIGEVGEALKINQSSALRLMNALEKFGLIVRPKGRRRVIILVDEAAHAAP